MTRPQHLGTAAALIVFLAATALLCALTIYAGPADEPLEKGSRPARTAAGATAESLPDASDEDYMRPEASEINAESIAAGAWGEPVEGLRAAIVLASPPVTPQNLLRYTIVIENVGKRAIRFAAAIQHEYGFYRTVIKDAGGQELERHQGQMHRYADRPVLKRFILRPGELVAVDTCATRLMQVDEQGRAVEQSPQYAGLHYFNIVPGTYDVSANVQLGPRMESIDPTSKKRTVLSPRDGEWTGKLSTGSVPVELFSE